MSSAASAPSADLKGKTAVITGAARGLGLVIAESLAREGVRIAGVDVKSDELSSAMKAVGSKYGVETLAFTGDISNEATVKSLMVETLKKWGRIDVLVNNAGIRKIAPVWDTSAAMWDEIHNANLKGHFLCTR
ncbi:MAG TPA: SDR family NAD(P)-dependent oxidoreductase, partial [Gemmatimonadaceae bacterium]|nr:SDR family NAD(P)-dependent oxidoreductase [Gemmatimonadaceae bacterium]